MFKLNLSQLSPRSGTPGKEFQRIFSVKSTNCPRNCHGIKFIPYKRYTDSKTMSLNFRTPPPPPSYFSGSTDPGNCHHQPCLNRANFLDYEVLTPLSCQFSLYESCLPLNSRLNRVNFLSCVGRVSSFGFAAKPSL